MAILSEFPSCGTDKTENVEDDDPTEEDEFGPGQPKEPMGSLQRWQDSGVRSILLTREVFNVEEHPLKEQGEINIENTTENEDLTKECNDRGDNTIENTTENDDLIKKDDDAEGFIRYVSSHSFIMCVSPYVSLRNVSPYVPLSARRSPPAASVSFRTLKGDSPDLERFYSVFLEKNEVLDDICCFRDLERFYSVFLEKIRLCNILSRDEIATQLGLEPAHQKEEKWDKKIVDLLFTDPEGEKSQMRKRNNRKINKFSWNSQSEGDKKIADLLFTDPEGEKNQMIKRMNRKIDKFSWNSQSEGDKKIADLLSTDPEGEKSQIRKRNNRKINKFSWNSQSEGTNGIAHELKGLFVFMRGITWILCFLIASSHVVVADTALTKELSVAVSSDIELCGLKCDKSGMYTLDRAVGVPILDYFCPEKSIYYHDWNRERLEVNISTGCCIIKNALKNDTGDYDLIFQGTKNDVWVQKTSCLVMDPVSVSNITSNLDESGMKMILSISYSGEEATAVWTWNGGALPERHQLSDSNKTLTVPSTDTGTFTVLVSNPVSHRIDMCVLPRPEELRDRKVEIGLCAALMIVTGIAVVALKGTARKKIEGLKLKAANENLATAENLVSQPSCAVSVDGPTNEKSEMIL